MRSRAWMRVAMALVFVAIVAGLYLSPVREHLTREQISLWVSSARSVWWGPIAYTIVFALACIFVLPASIFVIAAGVIWGWLLGGLYAIAGALIGAVTSFLLGRFMGEGILERFGQLGRAVARRVDHAGFRSLLLIRSVPGLPFAVVNYGAGVAGVRFGDFTLATAIALLPTTFVFTWCADELFNGTMSEGEAFRRLLIVGAVLAAMVLVSLLLRRKAELEGIAPPRDAG